jgi:DNA ligase (NAD+)
MGSFEQQSRKLAHFAGRSALDIGGMGRETVRLLMEQKLVSEFDDFFTLTADELRTLPLFEETKANKLIAALEDARKVPFDRLLIGLGIPHIGEENAYLLATHFPTLKHLSEVREESLSSVEGIGPIIGKAVAAWFRDSGNRALLSRLEKYLTIQKVKAPEKGPLTGLTVVITGTLPTLSREEAEALVRRAGGKASGSVSKKTSFVVAGESAGSKLETAQKLDVPVIDEAEFRKKLAA